MNPPQGHYAVKENLKASLVHEEIHPNNRLHLASYSSGIDRIIIDLIQAEKDEQLKAANEKTLALKSELLDEVEHRVHKPINLLRASLESVRINTYGESREITENSIRQLNSIDKYLNSITKAN